MSLPPVVSDPERCPQRLVSAGVAGNAEYLPHDWELSYLAFALNGPEVEVLVCRYCGGRKP